MRALYCLAKRNGLLFFAEMNRSLASASKQKQHKIKEKKSL